jgi:hypothetical protein
MGKLGVITFQKQEFFLQVYQSCSITSVIEQLPLKNGRFGGFLQKIHQIRETCKPSEAWQRTNRVLEQVH